MSWIDELNSRQDIGIDDRLSWNKYAQQELARKSPKRPKQNDKGFWTDQISTGGGIAGALGGAAAGAAAGSVVPVFGTAVGGLLGAILGGAAGSGGGEIAENFITDEEDKFKNVGSEALIGGATSVPITAGLKLLRAGTKAAAGLGKQSAGDLVQEAGVQSIGRKQLGNMSANGKLDEGATAALGRLRKTPTNTTPGLPGDAAMKMSTSGKLRESGNRALASQYGTVSKPVAAANDPLATFGQLADYGLTKPIDVERIAGQVTGADGLVNKAVLRATAGASGVDTNTLRQVFNDALDNYGLVEKDRASLQKTFDAQMNRLSGGAQGSISPTVDPSDALATMKSFEKRIRNLQGKGENSRLSTPERLDQASVLQLVRDELQDRLYEGAGANAQLPRVLTPELRNQLSELMPNNPKWAQYVDNQVMGAKTVGELRSAMAPFARASRIIDEGETNAMTFGGRAGNLANAGGFRNAAADLAVNAVRNPAARGYSGITRRLPNMPARTDGAVGQSVMGATARQAGGRLLTADAEPAQPATFEEAIAGLPPQSVDPAAQAMEAPQANPFGVSQEEVAQALVRAMAAGDEDATNQLQDLYAMVQEYESSDAGGEMNSVTQKALTSNANAEVGLEQLEQALNEAGGGSGKFFGSIASGMGDLGLNETVGTYNDMLQSYVPSILQALGKTDAPSETELRGIIKALPQVTDSPEKAQEKLANLRGRIAAAKQNTLTFSSGQPTTFEESLLMAQ